MKRTVLGLLLGFVLLFGGVGSSYADAAADHRKFYMETVMRYRQAAEEGNARAQYNLGILYSSYLPGFMPNYKEAVKWFRKASEQGHTSAQYNLGVMYYKGQGVTQDYKQAVVWYRKAAEQGNANAQYNLGAGYWVGQGVIKDIVYAHMWWNLAAANGDNGAATNRNIAEKFMTSSQIEKAQDLARECVRKKYKGC